MNAPVCVICSSIFSNQTPCGTGKNRGFVRRYHDRNKFAVLGIIALLPGYELPRVCERNASRHSSGDGLESRISGSGARRG